MCRNSNIHFQTNQNLTWDKNLFILLVDEILSRFFLLLLELNSFKYTDVRLLSWFFSFKTESNISFKKQIFEKGSVFSFNRATYQKHNYNRLLSSIKIANVDLSSS